MLKNTNDFFETVSKSKYNLNYNALGLELRNCYDTALMKLEAGRELGADVHNYDIYYVIENLNKFDEKHHAGIVDRASVKADRTTFYYRIKPLLKRLAN
jgi:hypothetical protein